MLIGSEIDHEIDKSESKKEIKSLHLRLAGLQRRSKDLGIPIIIFISGPSASGKGRMVSELLKELDPRGYKLRTVPSPPTDDIRYPFFRRYWYRLPANGTIGIFIDNWYRALLHRFKGFKSNREQSDWCARINTVERQLTVSGARIFKFYLNISKKEQKKRLKKLAADKNTSWRINTEDKQMLKEFNKFLENADRILEGTHSPIAPWTVLPADNGQLSLLILLKTLVTELEKEKSGIEHTADKITPPPNANNSTQVPRLDNADLSLTIGRDEYEESLAQLQSRLQILHNKVYQKKIPVMIAYEGWDAAGKGGNIKRLAHSLDPRGYEVLPIGAPAGDEKSHHYLWRFWKRVPRTGHIAIFDRTWYGRVLVEKVEGFCTPEECERAYSEIMEMEREWTKSGIVLLKFWIHIDKDEQLRRFKERENSSHKQWKITDEDWRNREKWDQYCDAVDKMLLRTHSQWAPWTVVESNCKLYARIKVLKTVIKTLESHI
ncbi:MAG TPA: polyphosphate:AMP phosphotransferase [candidate division Zixibacteria bacterium]|nr:polyphosphate:AMP phosphotransferase [candidate division Zixibacteria bacterium]